MPDKGRSGIGLLAFAVLAIVLILVVAVIAFSVGQQVVAAQQALRLAGIAPSRSRGRT